MIIRTELIKETCSKILTAVDDSAMSAASELLELEVKDSVLRLFVTNKEYFVEVKLPLDDEVPDFHATIAAKLFLKLIALMTNDTVELIAGEKDLTVISNGTYHFPYVFEQNQMMTLDKIVINNVTNDMTIDGEILNSILLHNSKEISKNVVLRPVQKLYYVDDKGCITFTSGACVNEFTLDSPIKVLFNSKLVKLFKLFKSGKVAFSIGYDSISSDITQAKARFESDDIVITAILPSEDALLNSVPVTAIRNRATTIHPYSVTISKSAFVETINRLLLFASEAKDISRFYGTLEFTPGYVTITHKNNKEILYYSGEQANITGTYTAMLDLTDIKSILDTTTDQYFTINFGDNQAVVIPRQNIRNVIPEIHTNAD